MTAMEGLPAPYTGPALWFHTSKSRFKERVLEWGMAVHQLLWGLILFLNPNVFDSKVWDGFKATFGTSGGLGIFMFIAGLTRLFGLAVNGSRQTVTPHIRQWSAAFGCFVWVTVCHQFFLSGVWSTWIAVYPLFAIKELYCIYNAAYDQGKIKNGKLS
jgi:hypothetical protein